MHIRGLQEYQTAVEMGKSEVLHSGCKVAVLALGSMVEICAEVCSELQKEGIDSTFVNVRFVKPLDTALLDQLARNHSLVVTVEENVQNGGFGQQVCGYMEEHHPGIQVLQWLFRIVLCLMEVWTVLGYSWGLAPMPLQRR